MGNGAGGVGGCGASVGGEGAGGAGGKTEYHVLAASGSEGHWMAETEGGVSLAGPELDRALAPQPGVDKKK